MNQVRSSKCISLAAVLGVAALSLLLVGQASASGNPNQGGQASVAVATVCGLDGSDFTVEIRVRDKTSGDAQARVTAWSVSALAKLAPGPWKGDNVEEFGSGGASGLTQPLGAAFFDTFSLCVGTDGSHVINPLIDGAKAINAAVTVTYGHLLEDGTVDEDGTISNMCSDDPETEEVEPSGIKLDAETLDAIAAACEAL